MHCAIVTSCSMCTCSPEYHGILRPIKTMGILIVNAYTRLVLLCTSWALYTLAGNYGKTRGQMDAYMYFSGPSFNFLVR